MAGELSAPRAREPRLAAFLPGLTTIALRRRLYGLGSIFGKTLRDSRLSFIIAAGMLGGYVTWKYGAMLALGTAAWSIMALTGTLAYGDPALGAWGFGRRDVER